MAKVKAKKPKAKVRLHAIWPSTEAEKAEALLAQVKVKVPHADYHNRKRR